MICCNVRPATFAGIAIYVTELELNNVKWRHTPLGNEMRK